MGSASNTKASRRWHIQHAVGPDSGFFLLFFFTRIEWDWEHNYSLGGLNQWITQLGSSRHQMRAEDNEKKKNNEGARIVFGWGALGTFSPQRLEEYGKRHLRSRRQYVQKNQRSQGVEDTGRQLRQATFNDTSESDKECNRSNSHGWLDLMPHCPLPLELWLQLAAFESPAAKFLFFLKKKREKRAKLTHRAEALSGCISPGQDERKPWLENKKTVHTMTDKSPTDGKI